ncbi:MAG: thioredoxin family protein [Tepidisphaeraceae bacterium]
MPRFFVLLLALLLPLCLVSTARAQRSGDFLKSDAKLNATALQPGKPAVVAVVVTVQEGYHAQSSQSDLIAFSVKVDKLDAIAARDPVYAKGERLETPGTDPQDVYAGTFITYVPIDVSADAKPGDVTVSGTFMVQVCDDKGVCFQPQKVKWSVPTKVTTDAVQPANAEVFKGYAETVSTQPTTAPTTAPAASNTTPGTGPTTGGSEPLGWTLLVAFLVGIVLNVVPCVLPVLPIKAVGFYEAANHSRAKSFTFGLAFSLGIVAAFGVIALIAILTGGTWGALFSNKWFAIGITVVMILAALQSFGLLEFILPAKVSQLEAAHNTYTGNFAWGLITAVLSTPCTIGPFAGVIAIALASGPVLGALILMTVGAGMASPYLILSATPEVARNFPRTGPWPSVVKQMMGFLLLATAVFFAQPVLPAAIKGGVAWWIICGLVCLSAAFLMVRTIQIAPRPRPIVISGIFSGALAAMGIFLGLFFNRATVEWVNYSEQALADARAAGKTVIIDFTADWCVNCHVVESRVYADESTKRELGKRGVVTIKADLSDDDAPGWKLLAELSGSRSIPFTAVYNPGVDSPAKLIGIYSRDELMQTLQ